MIVRVLSLQQVTGVHYLPALHCNFFQPRTLHTDDAEAQQKIIYRYLVRIGGKQSNQV